MHFTVHNYCTYYSFIIPTIIVFFDWFNAFFVSFNGCYNSFNGRFIPINGYFSTINGSAIVHVWSKFEAKSKS